MHPIILNEITNYIEFLRQHGYGITISALDPLFRHYSDVLYKYRIHLPAYCNYMKNHPRTKGLCIYFKTKFESKTTSCLNYSCCYAGVEEFIYPVYYKRKQIICIHVSGFRGKLEKSKHYADLLSRKCGKQSRILYEELSTQIPDSALIESLVAPFKYMFSTLYLESNNLDIPLTLDNILYDKMLSYLTIHYAEPFHCHDLCTALNYSESYLRNIFKANAGITIVDKLNQIRAEHAAFLLQTTRLSITKIALLCGFESANYFSTVFRKYYSTTPTSYRRSFNDKETVKQP